MLNREIRNVKKKLRMNNSCDNGSQRTFRILKNIQFIPYLCEEQAQKGSSETEILTLKRNVFGVAFLC